MKHTTQPTMKDVAREAGVALGTVSRVFNGFPVGEEYRQRVEDAAYRLGYQVNNYARALKTNHTNSVALIMPSLRHPFFASLADELSACLAQRGYYSLLMITNFDPEAEKKSFALVRQNKVDGVIALSYTPDLEAVDGLPVVSIDRHFNNRTPCVSSDNFRGGQLAAEKLIELGCKNLLFIRIGPVIQGEADRRGPGFEDVCLRCGTAHNMLLVNDDETEAPIYQYLEEHLHEGQFEYDGIFCNTDGLARRVYAFLKNHHVRIPEDVQLIGYDGIADFSSGNYVCSTIVQPVSLMARSAVDLLLSEDGRRGGITHRLPVSYAPGGTTRESVASKVQTGTYNPFYSGRISERN